jgi:transposase
VSWIAALQLMFPEYVRPYVKSQKNDDRDAEAIAEARAASWPFRESAYWMPRPWSQPSVGARGFARGRDLAAWLGLVLRQLTTGGKPRLVGISKRGNKYLRKLLIHGARAALPTLLESPTSLGAWLRGLLARMHKNAVVVALANKLARMAWAVIRQGKTFNIAGSALA